MFEGLVKFYLFMVPDNGRDEGCPAKLGRRAGAASRLAWPVFGVSSGLATTRETASCTMRDTWMNY